MHKIVAVALIACSLFTSGCLPVLVGGLIYKGTANKENYSHYVIETQKLNTEREIKNLKPIPVLTYDEWSDGITKQPESASK
jgi:hypothetical protein